GVDATTQRNEGDQQSGQLHIFLLWKTSEEDSTECRMKAIACASSIQQGRQGPWRARHGRGARVTPTAPGTLSDTMRTCIVLVLLAACTATQTPRTLGKGGKALGLSTGGPVTRS